MFSQKKPGFMGSTPNYLRQASKDVSLVSKLTSKLRGFASLHDVTRYGILAAIIASATAYILAPMAASLVEDWSRRDVELRSSLVFNSVGGILGKLIANNDGTTINELFERVAADARVVAVAFCENADKPRAASKLMPTTLSCSKISRTDAQSFSTVIANGHPMLIGAFPLSTRESTGHFIIVHDLSFAEQRGLQARNYLTLILGSIILASGVVATALVVFTGRRWLGNFKKALLTVSNGGDIGGTTSLGPLDKEIQTVLRQLELSRSVMPGDDTWNKNSLRDILRSELPGAEVLVVANREPYIHNRSADGRIEVQTPASGLVSALEPVMRAFGGTWIAHGSGSADAEMVDAHDRIMVPPDDPLYTLRRVWISEEEQDGYYYGLANEGLWPLCHIAFTRPVFREEDWQAYRSINERFADAVVAEATTADPIVLVQDYHFGLLPQMIRERIPAATIVTFWHIPWPNSETFSIFPWKEEVIRGLLGSSVLGFHTQFHCNNFLEGVDRFMESRIDREDHTVCLGGQETLIRPYPISIEWPPAALNKQKGIAECRRNVRAAQGIPEDVMIAVGIERFDYTKGVLDRMRAVDALLIGHPEWRGKFVMLQAAAPTRSKLASYKALQDEAVQLAEEINSRHITSGPPPIRLIVRHHEPSEVYELFRAADVCIVSSLHDGMNLVAKEFIAARDDEQGVLLLSHFAGASRELPEALIINPYNPHAMAQALHQALVMPPEEQCARMRLMRSLVRSRNVYRWAGQMLLDASRLRKKRKILQIAKVAQP